MNTSNFKYDYKNISERVKEITFLIFLKYTEFLMQDSQL